MNIQQAAELLAEIQIVDNRKIDEATILTWHRNLRDLDLRVALEAVDLHRQESDVYLQPVHVRRLSERIALAGVPREDDFGNVIEPDGAALAAYRRVNGAKAVTS